VSADPRSAGAYAAQFDDLFSRASQRAGCRHYLAGLLLPAERTKTLTALANAEPVVGAQRPGVQRLQWFLSEPTWDAAAVTSRRLALRRVRAWLELALVLWRGGRRATAAASH
jgi:SRSO17 transposase